MPMSSLCSLLQPIRSSFVLLCSPPSFSQTCLTLLPRLPLSRSNQTAPFRSLTYASNLASAPGASYKTFFFPLPSSSTMQGLVTLKEEQSIISGGTTGLRTWIARYVSHPANYSSHSLSRFVFRPFPRLRRVLTLSSESPARSKPPTGRIPLSSVFQFAVSIKSARAGLGNRVLGRLGRKVDGGVERRGAPPDGLR